MEKELGTIIHYFDKIGVGVIALKAPLAVGDTIKIVKGENEFEQEVESMQIEHEDIQSAKKGDEPAVKLDQPTKSGARVYQTG